MISDIGLNDEQVEMLNGERGIAKQMAMRLLLDMAAAAGAKELVAIDSAHLSGVSPLTGGLGLRRFLAKLAADPQAHVVVPTTLNAAGCDAVQFEAMRISVPGFLEQSQEIVALYKRLGVQTTQSCIPYEWEGVIKQGKAAWSESNAICFGNSYCGLLSNRESGLSALASALTGYTPLYGLLTDEARRPNIEVIVTCALEDPTDFSILGDWIGKQRQANWRLPFGPIPLIKGLPAGLNHEQRKALTAAAANYGSALLYIEGLAEHPAIKELQAKLTFDESELALRYEDLKPKTPVSLITIGCPQASLGEIRATAELLRGRKVTASPETRRGQPPLWIFTSSANRAIAEKIGLAQIIADSGALLLENTCPEVVPYDQQWVKHILTNSMKAEHYLKSGLNRIPTSVMRLADCIAVACGELRIQDDAAVKSGSNDIIRSKVSSSAKQSFGPTDRQMTGQFVALGRGLPSQGDFKVVAKAFVSEVPITLLGFVNRESGIVEEAGHPADGQSMAGKIAIFPRGTGSTVAPYVLLELHYRGNAPVAIVNTEIDQQSAPACSLENIPYAYQFDKDVILGVGNDDTVELSRQGEKVTLRVLSRASAGPR